MSRATPLIIGILVGVGLASAQDATTPTTTQTTSSTASPAPIQRDLQAVTLANQSYQAMTGVTALQDATLQAAATWIAGSDEEIGTATFEAKGNQEGRLVLSLTDGQRQEVRNALQGPKGAWAGPDGTWYPLAPHNCLTDASWFFPAFTLQAALNDPTVSMLYAGPDTFGGLAVIHLILYSTVSGSDPSTIKLIQNLSTVHILLDATSGLPLGVQFNTHPDNDAGLDIPVEIRFSNYKSVSGIQVPMRVTKFLQGSPLLDLHVSAVQINSGLSDSAFALPILATLRQPTDPSRLSGLIRQRQPSHTLGFQVLSLKQSKTHRTEKRALRSKSSRASGGAQ